MKPIGTEHLPLFTATQVGLAARDRTASRHARDIERLLPLARELAQRAGPSGVTVSDLRLAAVQRGLLTGEERGRELSWLGKVCEAAGLVNTGRTRRSVIVRSHGNRHSVFVAPEYAEAA